MSPSAYRSLVRSCRRTRAILPQFGICGTQAATCRPSTHLAREGRVRDPFVNDVHPRQGVCALVGDANHFAGHCAAVRGESDRAPFEAPSAGRCAAPKRVAQRATHARAVARIGSRFGRLVAHSSRDRVGVPDRFRVCRAATSPSSAAIAHWGDRPIPAPSGPPCPSSLIQHGRIHGTPCPSAQRAEARGVAWDVCQTVAARRQAHALARPSWIPEVTK